MVNFGRATFGYDDLRSEVKCIPQPEAYPIVLQQQWYEEKLAQVQCKVEWKERIRVYIKRVCPLNFGIRRS